MEPEEKESGFVEGEELVGSLKNPAELEALKKPEPKPFVKKAGLTKAFTATPKDQLLEARDREVQLVNFISQQSKLIEQMQNRLNQLEVAQSKAAVEAANRAAKEQEMLDKTGVKKIGGQLYAGGASVTPPSSFNIPSLEPVIGPTEDEGEATTFSTAGYNGETPFVVHNPHRMQVRVHDLKTNPQDKEDVGLLIQPFSTIDLRELFPEDRIKSSRGLKHVLGKGILVAAPDDAESGQPEQEPDSVQKRLAKAIGKVPRRGKITRNPKTGKVEREQGINDPELQRAVEQHVSQQTLYDKALEEAREIEESGANIV